jgi:hypothetical protein
MLGRRNHTLYGAWLIWDGLANDPFRHQNCAPTKQDRQHVTNCKVNIISGLPQETRRLGVARFLRGSFGFCARQQSEFAPLPVAVDVDETDLAQPVEL